VAFVFVALGLTRVEFRDAGGDSFVTGDAVVQGSLCKPQPATRFRAAFSSGKALEIVGEAARISAAQRDPLIGGSPG